MSEKAWRVEARIGKTLETAVTMGRHSMCADEPERLGGSDAGPNPYDLVLAALATCTLMTIRIVADKRDIPLEAAEVRLAYREVPPEEREEDEDGRTPREDRIDMHVRLEGDFDEKQRKRLHKAAGQCPVHKTYDHGIDVVTHFDD